MSWIESHSSMRNHPKTEDLGALLDAADAEPSWQAAAIGHMHCLWWWALDYAEDGDLTEFSAGRISRAALWQGRPVDFIDAATEAGYLDRVGDRLVIHGWQEYAGRLLARREANRQSAARSAGRRKNGTDSDGGTRLATGCLQSGHLPTNQPTNSTDVESSKDSTSSEDRLCALARTAIPGWLMRLDDVEVFVRLLKSWSEEQIADTITRLAADQATRTKPYSDPRRALANWLKRVKPAKPAPRTPRRKLTWQQEYALKWFEGLGWMSIYEVGHEDEAAKIRERATRREFSKAEVLAGTAP